MKIRLLNKANEPITNWLIKLNNKDLLCEDLDQIDLLPMGGIIDCDTFDFEYDKDCRSSYLINIKDFTDNVRKNEIYLGCCGHFGETANIFDKSGNEIGFEFGDCYMCHYVRIPKENVIVEMQENTDEFTLFAISRYEHKDYIIDRIIGYDKDEICKKLMRQVDKRLAFELSKITVRKEMRRNIKYLNLNTLKTKYLINKKIEDMFLFTKYNNQKSLLYRY